MPKDIYIQKYCMNLTYIYNFKTVKHVETSYRTVVTMVGWEDVEQWVKCCKCVRLKKRGGI
jgi:hypothetical protein